MKSSVIGLILIVSGILALIFNGSTFTTPKKVFDAGPIEVVKEKEHTLKWSPVVGIVLIAVGAGFMFVSTRHYSAR